MEGETILEFSLRRERESERKELFKQVALSFVANDRDWTKACFLYDVTNCVDRILEAAENYAKEAAK